MANASVQKILVPVVLGGLLVGGGVWYFARMQATNVRTACTMEAKVCPDGSAVGRTGPNCEFAPCPGSPGPQPAPAPTPSGNCTSDAQCPPGAMCQAIQGSGTVSPYGGTSTFTIEKGECKGKEGSRCASSDDCQTGLLCHDRICTAPQDGECAGPDGSCPQGYRCIQDCGPPLARVNEPPPGWHCLLEEAASRPRMCPICLASNAMIDTPKGQVGVKDVKVGMAVWSVDRHGKKKASEVLRVARTPVPPTHQVIRLVLKDGREVWVSPDHPTVDGRRVADLHRGDAYGGSVVASSDSVPYWDTATYDLLPAGDTGDYWADGIPLGSTLSSGRE